MAVLGAEKPQPALPGFTAELCALFPFSLALSDKPGPKVLGLQGVKMLRAQRTTAQLESLPEIWLGLGEDTQSEVGPANRQAQSCLNLGLAGKLICQACGNIVKQQTDGVIRPSETIGIR